MQSGQFNKNITIYVEKIATDDMGFEDKVEVVICTDRAKVSHIKSNEMIRNNVSIYTPRKKLTIRKRMDVVIDTDMLISLDNQRYNIIDIDSNSDRLYTHLYIERMVE